MQDIDFLGELERCELCEHRCAVNRLKGERGVCRVTVPAVASTALHPAPPESYTVFMAGCNFKCVNCQNWTISQYPDNSYAQRGYEDPKELAEECIKKLHSSSARVMKADRIFFSGGEPTIHLPYIEKVVQEARKIEPGTKVNFDTNGYMTESSLAKVIGFTTSITYDLKAYRDEVHIALTGASSLPVLRNAELIGKYAKDKLWEYRILVIPKITEYEVRPLVEFIAAIDPDLPVCFLAFRPNFILEDHPGAAMNLMNQCVSIAKSAGLKRAYWSGHTGIQGKFIALEEGIGVNYRSSSALLTGSYAFHAGCETHPRYCNRCTFQHSCRVKKYIPVRVT